jgi:hypothetical protein
MSSGALTTQVSVAVSRQALLGRLGPKKTGAGLTLPPPDYCNYRSKLSLSFKTSGLFS